MPTDPCFRIVDCTLREGEQFALSRFTSDQRVSIARALDAFGADVIELTSPVASPRAAQDLARVAGLGLRAQVATHVRCRRDDAEAALAAGVDAVHLLYGTSQRLQEHSHGADLAAIIAAAREVVPLLLDAGVTVRFSCEDAFRTPLSDLLRVAQAVEDLGVHRIGLADTVGVACPDEVARRVGVLRQAVSCEIEFHGHNDGGCAVANAWAAWNAGATHLDVTVLGIGERNGIAPLSDLVARAMQSAPQVLSPYELRLLPSLDALVAEAVGIDVPFTACITSPTAFTHKAGMHTKAVLAEPSCYEPFDPSVFGRERDLLVGHALVGRHAVRRRAQELGLSLDDASLRRATTALKALGDDGTPDAARVDTLLRQHAADAATAP
ncbi:MAG: homocitrate synthase [Planctomycetota bacterium]|nr:MAG: homocitrate synthase [Planctomycetota bacterium]